MAKEKVVFDGVFNTAKIIQLHGIVNDAGQSG